MNAEKAQVWEIERHWSLGRLFDAVDAIDHYADRSTWLRPKKPTGPRR